MIHLPDGVIGALAVVLVRVVVGAIVLAALPSKADGDEGHGEDSSSNDGDTST